MDLAARAPNTEMNTWYLDEGTLTGPLPDVISSIRQVKAEMIKVCLNINTGKCEATFLESFANDTKLSALQKLHGVPIHDALTRRALLKGQLMVDKLVRRLQALDEAHQAFFLLKNYVSVPRLLYLLRSSPTHRCPAQLNRIDKAVRRGMESIRNVQMRGVSWRQATLPVGLGGLGVRRVADVTLPAHLASQVVSADTIASIKGRI